MTTWSVEEQQDGSVVLAWDRKRQSFPSEDAAVRFIKANRSPQDRVMKVEKDGYTTPMNRRRWRGRGYDL
jgi:hypothetical protein